MSLSIQGWHLERHHFLEATRTQACEFVVRVGPFHRHQSTLPGAQMPRQFDKTAQFGKGARDHDIKRPLRPERLDPLRLHCHVGQLQLRDRLAQESSLLAVAVEQHDFALWLRHRHRDTRKAASGAHIDRPPGR